MTEKHLATFAPTDAERTLLLERSSLVDRITDLLRSFIVEGRVRPGARLVERQLADQLGISRVPVREALIQLEKEGLVVSRPSGRYVIQPSEEDIKQLFQVRRVLEALAADLAAANVTPDRAAALQAKLQEMRDALAREDRTTYAKSDFAIHALIWRQANNPYLLKMLEALIGPISMIIADNVGDFPWEETVELHQQLVDCIAAGDRQSAVEAANDHMDHGIRRTYQIFRNQR